MLRGGGLGVPGRSWFRDTLKMRSYLDKNLSFEREACDSLGEENFKQREESTQRSPGESVLHVCFRSDLEASVRGYPIK